jgi:hypothetical protein
MSDPSVPGLDARFGEIGWWPDPTETYTCSRRTSAHGYTPLMVLVVSGRDANGRLRRHDEFVRLLSNKSEYAATNSCGWTALMLAARYAGTHSTEETLRLLLAHPTAPQVALQYNSSCSSALSLALLHHRPDHLPTDEFHTSSDTAALMLLDHESAPALNDTCDIDGKGLLDAVSCGAIHAWHSHHSISRAYVRLYTERSTQEMAKEPAGTIYQGYAISCLQARVAELEQRLEERATLTNALKAGLSLPGSTVLLYL